MIELNKIPLINKAIALFTSLSSMILVVYFYDILPWLKDFTEKNVQTFDGIIDDNQVFILEITIVFFICLGALTSIILLFNLHKRFFAFISSIFETQKLSTTFIMDDEVASNTFTKRVLIFSTVFAIILHLKIVITGEPEKENTLENISSLLFLTSAIILIIAFFKLKYFEAPKKDRRIVKYWVVLCILALLFIFIEEISYGQHIFNWEASGIFKENNFQSETNLHNFINPFYRFIYPLAGIGLFAILSLLWFYYRGNKPQWLQLLTPHPSLFILVFYMAASTYLGHSESYELMLSLFTFLYGLRLLFCLKHLKAPKKV